MKRSKKTVRQKGQVNFLGTRHYFVLLVLISLLAGLMARALYLQVVEQDFLTSQGVQRQIRTIETPAYRGAILDRFGTPLAISTPVDSVWVNPSEILGDLAALKQVTRKLGLDYRTTVTMLKQRADREFVYLKRQVSPAMANYVSQLKLPGVSLKPESRRFYPTGEVSAQLVGFTNIDDLGQEGIERSYDDWLSGKPGKRKVRKERLEYLVIGSTIPWHWKFWNAPLVASCLGNRVPGFHMEQACATGLQATVLAAPARRRGVSLTGPRSGQGHAGNRHGQRE